MVVPENNASWHAANLFGGGGGGGSVSPRRQSQKITHPGTQPIFSGGGGRGVGEASTKVQVSLATLSTLVPPLSLSVFRRLSFMLDRLESFVCLIHVCFAVSNSVHPL